MNSLFLDPHRLKTARKRAGIKQQKKLAEMAQVSLGTIQAYEQNRGHSPNFSTLRSLAKAVNCSIEYLTGQQEDFGRYQEHMNEESFKNSIVPCSLCQHKDWLIKSLNQQLEDQRKLHVSEKKTLKLKIQLLEETLKQVKR